MGDEYIKRLKIIQEEQEEILHLQKLIGEKEKNISLIEKAISGILNIKRDYLVISRKAKEKNFEFFNLGIKNCLSCGNQSKEERVTHGTWNLNSVCTKCQSKCWLVGDNYPCEICEKITLVPIVHHIDSNRKNQSFENLAFICNACHTAIHLVDFDDMKRISTKKRNKYPPELINKIKEYQKKLNT